MATKLWIGGDGSGTQQTDASRAANYSPSGTPTNGDSLVFQGQTTDYSVNTGLTALSAISLASLTIGLSYTGQIGVYGATNSYLQVGASLVNIGANYSGATTAGSGQIMLDLGSTVPAAVFVANSATSANTNTGAVQLLGSHTGHTIAVGGGSVSIAYTIGESTTIGSLTLLGGSTLLGSGVTLTTANVDGGSLLLQSAATTVNVNAGSLETEGSGAITTLNITSGGAAVLNSTGTITTLNLTGSADFSQNPVARTVTTINVYPGYVLNLDNGKKGSVTLTNGVIAQNCRISDGTLTAWNASTYKLS